MIEFTLRPATAADYEFVYEVKKAALGPYVEQTWGWDEQFQRQHHEKGFDASQTQIIISQDGDLGLLSVTRLPAEIQINELYILPDCQNHGIGTRLIGDILSEAGQKRLPVRLQVLKVNPARRLYERLGFQVTGQTDHHYQMRHSTNSALEDPGMDESTITEKDRKRAAGCLDCPVCKRARARQKGFCYWFVKRVEGSLCPNCRAYEKVYGRKAHQPIPEDQQPVS